jgi:hypothetical protein
MGYRDRLALDYLSKMKIAVMVRQLDLGHILWCARVVRVVHPRGHRAAAEAGGGAAVGVERGPGRLGALRHN